MGNHLKQSVEVGAWPGPVDGLRVNVDFCPSPLRLGLFLGRLTRGVIYARRPPKFIVIQAPIVGGGARWAIYFIYAPFGIVSQSHIYALRALKDSGLQVLVVFAAPLGGCIPDSIRSYADAYIWKELAGYDFSGYSIGIGALSMVNEGVDVLVLNDSVYGPLYDCSRLFDMCRWDLTGLTGSSSDENHIQSYGFMIRGLDAHKARVLGAATLKGISYNRADENILCKELRFARRACNDIKVGSFWFGDPEIVDPMLMRGPSLVRAGLPFYKKSLLGKMKGFQDVDLSKSLLQGFGCPLD